MDHTKKSDSHETHDKHEKHGDHCGHHGAGDHGKQGGKHAHQHENGSEPEKKTEAKDKSAGG